MEESGHHDHGPGSWLGQAESFSHPVPGPANSAGQDRTFGPPPPGRDGGERGSPLPPEFGAAVAWNAASDYFPLAARTGEAGGTALRGGVFLQGNNFNESRRMILFFRR